MGATEPIVGVDFGTHDSKAAMLVDDRVHLVLDEGLGHVPSVVVVPSHGDLVVGREQAPRLGAGLERTITSIKRLLGRKYDDPEVRTLDQSVGYKIACGPDGSAIVQVDQQALTTPQVVAAILRRIRERAESQRQCAIDRAVLSAPVVVADGFIPALKRAAALAGFGRVEIMREPLAAAWGANLPPAAQDRRVVICDFGGGTFDCALLVQGPNSLRVVGTVGDAFLGGDDFDSVLADAVSGQVFRAERVDLRRDAVTWAELVLRCERAKRQLSESDETLVELPREPGGKGAERVRVTRAAAEPRWQPLVERALTCTRQALDAAGWHAALVDELVLVGGTNLIPLVRKSFARAFARQPRAVIASDVVVAAGLARVGGFLDSRDPGISATLSQ